jgi:hypothetical protein
MDAEHLFPKTSMEYTDYLRVLVLRLAHGKQQQAFHGMEQSPHL